MKTSTLLNYIKKAITSVPSVHSWGVEGVPSKVEDTTGYSYAPLNTRIRGVPVLSYLFSTHDIQDLYYISEPKIFENDVNDTFIITFLVGLLYSQHELGLYATVSMEIKQSDGKDYAPPGESSLKISYYEKQKDHHIAAIIQDIPTPYSLSGVPDPVNNALSVMRSAQAVMTWMESQNFNDSTSRSILLEYYIMMFVNQIMFSIGKLYEGSPVQNVSAMSEVSSYYRSGISRWPSSENMGKWDDSVLSLSMNGVSVKLTKPTFMATDAVWTMTCKFDHDMFGTDDHLAVHVLGDFKYTDLTDHKILNVLGVSAVTEYSSSRNFSNDIVSDKGEDVYEKWTSDVLAKARDHAKNQDEIAFMSNVVNVLKSLLDYLESLEAAPHPNTYDVSQGGDQPVSFMADANERVFAGCAGYVYELDTHRDGLLHTHSMDTSPHVVSQSTSSDVLYVASQGKVQALDKNDGLRPLWTTTLQKVGDVSIANTSHLIVGCKGKVYLLDKDTGDIKLTLNLSRVNERADEGDISLMPVRNLLYCGCNGLLIALDLNDLTPKWVASLTSQAVPVALLPDLLGSVTASAKGLVQQYNQSGNVMWSHDLSTLNSHMGEGVMRLTYVVIDGAACVLVGANGYVVKIRSYDGQIMKDRHSKTYWSVHDNGRGVTSLSSTGPVPVAGCEGNLYYLSSLNYEKSTRVSLHKSGETSVIFLGGSIYMGTCGKVYRQPLALSMENFE